MKNKLVSNIALVALMGSLSAAALAQNVAVVNGKAVPMARVEALSQQVARSGRQVTPEMQQQIKDEVIAREVFIQEAQKWDWTPLKTSKPKWNWPAKPF